MKIQSAIMTPDYTCLDKILPAIKTGSKESLGKDSFPGYSQVWKVIQPGDTQRTPCQCAAEEGNRHCPPLTVCNKDTGSKGSTQNHSQGAYKPSCSAPKAANNRDLHAITS
jgi:hypothetical protein